MVVIIQISCQYNNDESDQNGDSSGGSKNATLKQRQMCAYVHFYMKSVSVSIITSRERVFINFLKMYPLLSLTR